MKEKLEKQKGITLIALIISIIVMLILAVVSINIIMNQGIITKSQTATDTHQVAAEKEAIELAYSKYLTEKYNGEPATLEVADANATVTGNEESGWTITYANGNVYKLSKNGGEPEGPLTEETPGNNPGENEEPVKKVNEGDKVTYKEKVYTILYVYDDGTIEMVMNDTIGSFTDYNGNDFDEGINAYNNLSSRLNEYCKSLYENDKDIISVRTIGDTSDDENDEKISGLEDWNCTYHNESISIDNKIIKKVNKNEEDYNKLVKYDILKSNTNYWYPDRIPAVMSDNSRIYLYILARYASGGNTLDTYAVIENGGDAGFMKHTYAVRPVVKIQSSVLTSN